MRRLIFAMLTVVLVACGAGAGDHTASMPTIVPSATQLQEWQERATEVADSYWGAWPEDASFLEQLADDVIFYDPSDGDYAIEGSAVTSMLQGFIGYYADADPSVEAVFVSADSAVYRVAFPSGLWPPWSTEPSDHIPVVLLDVFRFRDTEITHYEVWYEDETLEMTEYGCFATEGCPEAKALVDRYVTAWTSGDNDEIAALYADNAVFTDSLLGIDAAGQAEISSLADKRFGSGAIDFEVLGVYAQTNGYRTATEESATLGDVIAVGIHYLVSARDTGDTILESLTTFELGTRQPESFERDPQSLVTREEVFYLPDTLASLAN